MKKYIKIFFTFLFATAFVMLSYLDTVYAYTIDDLESYIENPEWFDNQEGHKGNATGTGTIVWKNRANVNADTVYFYEKNETFQLVIRQYDKASDIDFDNDDFTWTSMDEQICTVDDTGLLTAGDMTGVTIVLAESKIGYREIAVVNLTGNHDDWYEKMFVGVDFGGYTSYHDKTNTEADYPAINSAKAHGNAYKTIVDAYLKHGEKLYSDPDIRYKTLRDAVYDAQLGGKKISVLFIMFSDADREQKCIYPISNWYDLILMDGKIYERNLLGGFYPIDEESTGTWKENRFFYNYSFVSLSTLQRENVKVEFGMKRNHSYTQDKDIMTEKLKPLFSFNEGERSIARTLINKSR